MVRTSSMPVENIVADITALRQRTPLVHCLTNDVVKGFTANILLAAGAAPAMIEAPGEADQFARVADSVLVNVGTLTVPQAEAIRAAVAAANEAGTPWVLDPVALGAVSLRTELAGQLVNHRPAVVRGNADEVRALADAGIGARSVAPASSTDAVDAAIALAGSTGAVVAVSGEVDYVTDGDVVYAVPGGDPLLTKVTGTGCALGALVAACTAATESPLRGAVAASTLMACAAELAARESAGPGSFAVALLDAFDRVDEPRLRERVS